MRLPFVLIALLALLALAGMPPLAQSEVEIDARLDTVMGDHAPFEASQTAVATDDAATLSTYIATTPRR